MRIKPTSAYKICGFIIYVENLLHVSATFCSHRQGDIVRRARHKELSNNVYKVVSFKYMI